MGRDRVGGFRGENPHGRDTTGSSNVDILTTGPSAPQNLLEHRNALPAFDPGVRTVRVRTDLPTAGRAPGYGDQDSPPIVVGYQGDSYRLTIEREDE